LKLKKYFIIAAGKRIEFDTHAKAVAWLEMMGLASLIPSITEYTEEIPYDPAEALLNTKVKPLSVFCEEFIQRFISQNMIMGITQQGKTRILGEVTKEVMYWVRAMSLREVIYEMDVLRERIAQGDPDVLACHPFISEERLVKCKAYVMDYLASPVW